MGNNNRNIPKIENIELDNFNFLVNASAHYIKEFAENMQIDNISGVSENVFCAMLKYFYMHFLRMDLYTTTKRTGAQTSIIDYNNAGELENILNVYLYICDCYNKIPSVYSFGCYSGISADLLNTWTAAGEINNVVLNNSVLNNDSLYSSISGVSSGDESAKLTKTRAKIQKTIVNRRETALSQRLESGGGGVGTIAVLNHCYGWNDTNNTINLSLQVPTISANNLPLLPPKMASNHD